MMRKGEIHSRHASISAERRKGRMFMFRHDGSKGQPQAAGEARNSAN